MSAALILIALVYGYIAGFAILALIGWWRG